MSDFVDRLVEMVGMLVGFSWFNFSFVWMLEKRGTQWKVKHTYKGKWDAIPLAIIWFVWKTRKELLFESPSSCLR